MIILEPLLWTYVISMVFLWIFVKIATTLEGKNEFCEFLFVVSFIPGLNTGATIIAIGVALVYCCVQTGLYDWILNKKI